MTVTLSDIHITGWGHTPFGRSAGGRQELIARAATEAIESAGIEASDIDEVWLGNFNGGLQDFSTASALVVDACPDLWGAPVTRVENACASGSSAFHAGLRAVRAGQARHVLVVGVEKMTDAAAEVVGKALLSADVETAGGDSAIGFAELFSRVADVYAERHQDPSDAMGRIAYKNHFNGLRNPMAQLHKDFTLEFSRTVSERNPAVSGRLRRSDCSPVSDGAAALVLSTAGGRSATARTDGVRVLGAGQATDFAHSEKRDPLAFAGSRLAWERALRQADLGTSHLSFVELHDCFTIAELVLYDAFGLSDPGKSVTDLDSGRFDRDGDLPVNPSGGLKSKGHPVGATGVSQIVMAAMQLSGTAGDMQLPQPSVGAVHNMGGLGLANNVTVLGAA